MLFCMEIKVSVRRLVEFILVSGDIDNSKGAGLFKDAMSEGSKLHRKIQKKMGSNYRSEVPIKYSVETEKFILTIEGRADGIITEDNEVTIDEIKGVYKNVELMDSPIYVHQAQAMCYGFIYAMENNLDKISIQMTYANIETEVIKRFKEEFTLVELEKWFQEILDKYLVWANYDYDNKILVKSSTKGKEFPYPYRDGQRDMTASVYTAINRKKNLFVQAPTGIGKTMAAIFPAVMALGEGHGEKIFYLTAKTITRTVAIDGFNHLRECGFHIKSIALTAKEKICICEEMDCNPGNCPFAKGHYDRVNQCVYDVITHENSITREIIIDYAMKHQVCPFEMSLDISVWVDAIICDYNYVFDPRASLKRYFAQGIKGEYIFLVDEAHNLVERASSMYSAQLYKEDFLQMKKIIEPLSKTLGKKLDKCNKELLVMKKECDKVNVVSGIGGFYLLLLNALSEYEKFLEEHRDIPNKKEVLDFYFQLSNFYNIYEKCDDSYVIYTENQGSTSFMVKLYCVHPATNLTECINKGNSTIFFSATLLPINYYKELLSNKVEDYAIYIPSPFEKENRRIVVAEDVSSKYTRRGLLEYEKMFAYIEEIVSGKQGNYMVFFPSYKMLNDIYEIALNHDFQHKVKLIKQDNFMNETSREEFLKSFYEHNNITAFCIMGGIFSEGIDLTNEKLIGAIIVGTGLPMVCNEREIVMDYFNQRESSGYEYAYLYPGMNKVLQAAGRVIRTHEDKGVIALLDERFLTKQYVSMFPLEWTDFIVTNKYKIQEEVRKFWQNVTM